MCEFDAGAYNEPTSPINATYACFTHRSSLRSLQSSNTVPTLYSLMNKTTLQRGGVLWCYKNELGFSSHRKKRMKKLKANAKRGITSDVTNDEVRRMVESFGCGLTPDRERATISQSSNTSFCSASSIISSRRPRWSFATTRILSGCSVGRTTWSFSRTSTP